MAKEFFVLKTHLKIKMSGSELQSRKVKLMHTHSEKTTTITMSILHITTKHVLVATKTSLMAVIFIS